MWHWFKSHSEALQALGALVTALAALAALVVIPLQIRAAEAIQQRQAAREMYRNLVALTIERPALVNSEYCDLRQPDQITAFSAYVEFLLYTAEQLMATDPTSWRSPLLGMMEEHITFFCADDDWQTYERAVQDLIEHLRQSCPPVPVCTAP